VWQFLVFAFPSALTRGTVVIPAPFDKLRSGDPQ